MKGAIRTVMVLPVLMCYGIPAHAMAECAIIGNWLHIIYPAERRAIQISTINDVTFRAGRGRGNLGEIMIKTQSNTTALCPDSKDAVLFYQLTQAKLVQDVPISDSINP